MTEVAITPVAFVRAIGRPIDAYSKDPGDALRGTVAKFLSDPRNRVTGSPNANPVWRAIQELDDEALGWFSRRPWGSYGDAVSGPPSDRQTLEVALKRWCRYHGLLTDDIALKFT